MTSCRQSVDGSIPPADCLVSSPVGRVANAAVCKTAKIGSYPIPASYYNKEKGYPMNMAEVTFLMEWIETHRIDAYVKIDSLQDALLDLLKVERIEGVVSPLLTDPVSN